MSALVFVAIMLALDTAMVVGVGTVLNFLLPAIPFEFACVVAGLSVLIGLSMSSGVYQFLRASLPPVQLNNDEFDDDEESEEFAEQIADIVSAKLEPHIGKLRRPKSRRR